MSLAEQVRQAQENVAKWPRWMLQDFRGSMSDTEERYEIIVRRHVIEHAPERKSTKSRRFNIYQRVFDPKNSEAVIASLERVLNGKPPR